MSCSKWRYTKACDNRICPGDCDLCNYEDEPKMLDKEDVLQMAWETLPQEWYEKFEERLQKI